LYLYFLGLSYKNTSKALSFLHIVEKSRCNLEMDSEISSSKNTIKKKDDFKIHNSGWETQLKAGSELIWLWWVAIDSKNKQILALSISKERETHLLHRTLSANHC